MRIDLAIKDFLQFIKKPQYAYKSHEPVAFSTLTLMYGVLFFLIVFISSPLMYLVGVENMQHSVDELMKNYPKWVFVLLTVIVAPVVEELIFRWHLRQPIIIFWVFAIVMCGGVGFAFQQHMISFWPTVIIISFIVSLLGMLLFSIVAQRALLVLYNKYFPLVFYLTVVVFAFAHIGNFSDVEKWYIAPILVLPQALISLFLGYVRVRNNLFWSIYFHAFHNLIPTMLFLMMPEPM